MKKDFVKAPHWSIEKWISVLAEGGQKKRFQYCLNPNYLHQFLYLGSTINPALQDNVLLPEGFTEYVHHLGNGKELRSIVNHGLIPGGGPILNTDRTGKEDNNEFYLIKESVPPRLSVV